MDEWSADGKMEMDHVAVRSLGLSVADLATALRDVQRYHTESGLAPADFGHTEHGEPAGAQFVEAVRGLGASVGKAATFTEGMAKRLEESAETTSGTDADAATDIGADRAVY